jgi:transposase
VKCEETWEGSHANWLTDEISIRKGHDYRIVVSDLERRRPIWFGGKDRKEASMVEFYAWLSPVKAKRLRLAVMDMWKPFRNATHMRAPQAAILFDKFHVLRHLNDALDKVRRSEYARLSGKQRGFVKGQKYTLLAHRENLSLQGRHAIKRLLAANKRLNTAYVLKESFGQLWDYQREGWARRFFENWRAALKWQRLKPYEEFAATIERHWDGIAAYSQPENNRVRGGSQQHAPRYPATRVRDTRREISATKNSHVHVARSVKLPKITHTISRRPIIGKGRRVPLFLLWRPSWTR